MHNSGISQCFLNAKEGALLFESWTILECGIDHMFGYGVVTCRLKQRIGVANRAREASMSDGPAEPKRAQTSLGKALRTVVGSRHQFNSHLERRHYNRRHVRIQPEPHLVGHVHRQASTTGEVASRPRL